MDTSKLKQDLVFTAKLCGHNLTFHSTWGLFSPKQIDEGTQLLVERIDVRPTDHILDLGCGYGPLGLALAKLAPQGTVDLVHKDFVAVEYSTKNAELNRISNTSSYLSNGFDQVPAGKKYDIIVSNVPAKIGSELLTIFLHDAHEHLNPSGNLYIVTISGLKDYMKRHLLEVFGHYDKLKQSKTYTAARATKN